MHSQEQLRVSDEYRQVGSSWGRWLRESQPWWYHEDGKNLQRNENASHFGHSARWMKVKTGLLSVVAENSDYWCLRQ